MPTQNYMFKRVYNGKKYVESIMMHTKRYKYNEKPKIGNHIEVLLRNGKLDLDYELNIINDHRVGISGNIKYWFTTENFIYLISSFGIIYKINYDLEVVKEYDFNETSVKACIDSDDNIYISKSRKIIKFNSNLEVVAERNFENYISEIKCLNGNILIVNILSFISTLNLSDLSDINTVEVGNLYSPFIEADSHNNIYIGYNDEITKLTPTLNKVNKVAMVYNEIFIMNDSLFIIDYFDTSKIIKLGDNLEVLKSYTVEYSSENYVCKNNYIYINNNNNIEKLDVDLNLIGSITAQYEMYFIVDDNENIYTMSPKNISKYGSNMQHLKDFNYNGVRYILHSYKYIFVYCNDHYLVLNENLDILKVLDDFSYEAFNIFYKNDFLYILKENMSILKLDSNINVVKENQKMNGGIYKFFIKDKLYAESEKELIKFNDNFEDVLKINTKNLGSSIVPTENYFYIFEREKTKLTKIHKNMYDVVTYDFKEMIGSVEHLNNDRIIVKSYSGIKVYDENMDLVSENPSLQSIYKIIKYTDEYIYALGHDNDIIKLNNNFDILKKYTATRYIESSHFCKDGTIIMLIGQKEIIRLNENLEEVNKFTTDSYIQGVYLIDDVCYFYLDNYLRKLSYDLVEEHSVRIGCAVRKVISYKNHIYVLSSNDLIKCTSLFNEIKRFNISNYTNILAANDNLYLYDMDTIVRFDTELSKLKEIDKIDLLEVYEKIEN